MARVMTLLALAGAVAAVVAALPDVKRYLRLRSM